MGGGPSGLVNRDKVKEETKLRSTIKDIVNKRKEETIEYGYKMNMDGTGIVEYVGEGTSVSIEECIDMVTIHNHPRQKYDVVGGPLSPNDLSSAIQMNEPISIAFDQERIYELRAINWKPSSQKMDYWERQDKAFDAKGKYNKAMQHASKELQKKVFEKMNNGDFSTNEEFVDSKLSMRWRAQEYQKACRKWLRNHAKEFGYEYHEYKI